MSFHKSMIQVTYQTEHFLDKNKDYVVPEHQELLGASKCEFVASLFPTSPVSSKSSKFSSIGTHFKVCQGCCTLLSLCLSLSRFLPFTFSPAIWVIIFPPTCLQQQLQALLETLSATEPHYIRCIKPNNLLKPAIFENKNVLQQLRCGVISCSKF